jgi:hypothetical protein
MNHPTGTPPPSVRVDKRQRPGWLPWLVGLLLLALLALILFFLFNGDDDDPAAGDSVGQEVVEDPDADVDADVDADAEVDADASAGADAGASTAATAEGPLVLTPPFAALADEEGREVTASNVEVVDVPADEAFTVGTADEELLVYLTPAARRGAGGESATNVEPGSTVTSLEGTLEPITDQFVSMLELDGDEADAVRQRGVYVAATAFELAG